MTNQEKQKAKKIIDELYEYIIKPLCKHPETGEQCEADYDYAIDAYNIVIKGLNKNCKIFK